MNLKNEAFTCALVHRRRSAYVCIKLRKCFALSYVNAKHLRVPLLITLCANILELECSTIGLNVNDITLTNILI